MAATRKSNQGRLGGKPRSMMADVLVNLMSRFGREVRNASSYSELFRRHTVTPNDIIVLSSFKSGAALGL